MRRIPLVLLLLWPMAALAALSPAALNSAGVILPRDARLPLALTAADLSGQRRSIAAVLAGKPAFVVFADYTCKTLCGPALVLLGAALTQSGLAPESYHLIVMGLDPKDSAADARRMLLAQVPVKLRAVTVFLLPDVQTVAAATTALGFRYVYDKSVDQFAHPEVAYAIAADGRVLRVLSPLTLTGFELASALSGDRQAPQTLSGRFRVLCYRFGVLSGIYDAPIALALKAAAALTVAAMAAGLFFLVRRKRPAWP